MDDPHLPFPFRQRFARRADIASALVADRSSGTILTDGSRSMMTTQEIRRHGERSEAIHGSARARPCRQWLDALALDGFVAALLAMTVADQAQGTHPLHFDHSDRRHASA
jgi:hypothetical protein